MPFLFVDVGSTFVKYSVYNEKTKEIRKTDRYPFPEAETDDGVHFTVSLAKINECILAIFEEAAAAHCSKAFLCVQMHGFVLRDANGSFGEYVSWRDKSADTESARLSEIDLNPMGTSLKANLPLAKLAFRGLRGEFFTLGSYIAWLLTKNNATHTTDACASGFFLAATGEPVPYAGELKMPKVYTLVTEVGSYSGIRVYTPVGDHQASFLGSGAQSEQYLLNIGTATQLSCVHNTDYPDGAYEKRPYFDRNRLYTVSGLIGGSQLFEGESPDRLLQQVLDAVKRLPPKREIVFGGGGSDAVCQYLTRAFEKCGLRCTKAKNNIGIEGLKMLAEAMEQNEIKAGTMLSEICFSNFPIIAKNNDLDFFIVDNEHGYFDYSDIAQLSVKSALVGLDMIVRIGDSSRGHITKLADMGVCGFLLPMTNTPEDIEQVIRFAKYPPVGKRGVSTTRAHTLYNPPPLSEYMPAANDRMKIYAQIETVEGVRNIDAILAVPEVSGIFIGPNDLSVDMECINDKESVLQAVIRIIEAANAAGKPCGIITGDKMLIETARQHGIKMVSIGSELNMLINGCKKIKEALTNG